jgi:hypothetical protein
MEVIVVLNTEIMLICATHGKGERRRKGLTHAHVAKSYGIIDDRLGMSSVLAVSGGKSSSSSIADCSFEMKSMVARSN